MKTKVIDILDDICNEIDAYVKDDYSGRNMFGRKCLAVSVSEFVPFIERAAQNGLTGAKIDNLGLGYVIYWPKYNTESEIDKMVLIAESELNELEPEVLDEDEDICEYETPQEMGWVGRDGRP